MKSKKKSGFGLDVLWLAIGTVAYAFIGWRWSAPAAAWIAPVFLLRFFRNQEKWYTPLLSLPLILMLYIDRALSPRLKGIWATLAFPAAYATIDYILGFTPLGTLFSAASTQFSFATIAQASSITVEHPSDYWALLDIDTPKVEADKYRLEIRGIEGGYSVVRQVNKGTSVAADHRGTVLARQDYFMTEDRLMFADVPIEGTRTLYGCLGDWFAWASIALLAALVGLIMKRRTQAK